VLLVSSVALTLWWAAAAGAVAPPEAASVRTTSLTLAGDAAVDAFFAGNGTDGLTAATAHVLAGIQIALGSGDGVALNISGTTRHIVILDSSFTGAKYGLVVHEAKSVKVVNCTIADNTADGVYLYGANFTNFTQNTVRGNGAYGIFLFNSTNNTIVANNICSNHYGYYFQDGLSKNNTITDNWCLDAPEIPGYDPAVVGLAAAMGVLAVGVRARRRRSAP
jgi:parallel beta-helix repeat protein